MILGRIIFDEMHGFVSSDYSELTDKQLYEIADRANKYDSLISEIERLKTERDEYRNSMLGMSAMLKNSEWANLLSTNDVIAELDIQITELHSDHSKLLNQRNELLKSLELMLDEDDGGMAAEQARQTIIRIEGGKS